MDSKAATSSLKACLVTADVPLLVGPTWATQHHAVHRSKTVCRKTRLLGLHRYSGHASQQLRCCRSMPLPLRQLFSKQGSHWKSGPRSAGTSLQGWIIRCTNSTCSDAGMAMCPFRPGASKLLLASPRREGQFGRDFLHSRHQARQSTAVFSPKTR